MWTTGSTDKYKVEEYKNALINFKYPEKDLYDIMQIISANNMTELKSIDIELEKRYNKTFQNNLQDKK